MTDKKPDEKKPEDRANNNPRLDEIRVEFIEEYGFMPKVIGPDGKPR